MWSALAHADGKLFLMVPARPGIEGSDLAKPGSLYTRHRDSGPTCVEHQCTASIGVALFVDHEASQDDILKSADMAMYRAKQTGRNLVQFYDSAA